MSPFALSRDVRPLDLRPVVPHTLSMERRLAALERDDPAARVVGLQDGLPVLRLGDGRKVVLTALGHLQRPGR